MITFLVSGLWHGANWTFVLWGGIHGCLQVLENIIERPLSEIRRHKLGKWIMISITFVLCSYLWIFFRAESITDALHVIMHMFDGFSDPVNYLTNNSIGLSKWTFSDYELYFSCRNI